MVAELVELRNLLLTAVNDFARAKQYFGAEYLNEVDGTYKVSRDGTPKRIGPAPWTLMDEACRSLHSFRFAGVKVGMASVLSEHPRDWWLNVLTRAKLMLHCWSDDDAWNRELGELQRAANAVDAAAALRQAIEDEPKRHTSATANRDGNVEALKAVLTKHHFDDDGEVIDGVQPYKAVAIAERMKTRQGKTRKGWSAASVSRLFEKVFDPDGSYSKYETLALNTPASLRRYLGDTEGRLPMTDGNKAVSVAQATVKR